MKKAPIKIKKQTLEKAITTSSKIEGLSFLRAKKNANVIKLLKAHDRAFSV
ncbi:MAG: hypothetical protein Q8P62_02605 [Candidatus Peregrinibacteria bacterium]|nr:hypothetical protein [Candidatus Peregrinibacteria bacterium]